MPSFIHSSHVRGAGCWHGSSAGAWPALVLVFQYRALYRDFLVESVDVGACIHRGPGFGGGGGCMIAVSRTEAG